MIRRPPRSTLSSSSAASDVYKRQRQDRTPRPRDVLCTANVEADVEHSEHQLARCDDRGIDDVGHAATLSECARLTAHHRQHRLPATPPTESADAMSTPTPAGYEPEHEQFRQTVRAFVANEITPLHEDCLLYTS